MKSNRVRKFIRFNFIGLLFIGVLSIYFPATGLSNASAQTITVTSARKISQDLVNAPYTDRADIKALVQLSGPESPALTDFFNRRDAKIQVRLINLPMIYVKLSSDALAAIQNFPEVEYISLTKPLKTMGQISKTTGADQVRSILGNVGLNGQNIGVAILDSGVDKEQNAFRKNSPNNVVLNLNFTAEDETKDVYGHGTHVASLITGSKNYASGGFEGIAPAARLLNLRVLNSAGTGDMDSLLKAIDWILSNRTLYNIRVVNLSLGMNASDSYRFDPVCRAARALTNAGVVVIAAAGNSGKDDRGNKIYGNIHSPGIEPSVITVGASNHKNTDTRADDTMASFSSRGPTRGSWYDVGGLRHFDNVIKPDLVAPGNKIVAADAKDNRIKRGHPNLNVTASDGTKMMTLSGTSMSTPMVAGTVALMLQANPNLTPSMVKTLLAYTAQPIAGYNWFEQGAGQLNIDGAVKLANAVRRDLTSTTPTGSWMLTSQMVPVQQSTISGYTFPWSGGVMINHSAVSGTSLITRYQRAYGNGFTINDGILVTDGLLFGDGILLSDGLLFGDSVLTSNGMLVSDGIPFFPVNLLMGDGLLFGDGLIFGDGMLVGDGLLFGDYIPLFDPVMINGE